MVEWKSITAQCWSRESHEWKFNSSISRAVDLWRPIESFRSFKRPIDIVSSQSSNFHLFPIWPKRFHLRKDPTFNWEFIWIGDEALRSLFPHDATLWLERRWIKMNPCGSYHRISFYVLTQSPKQSEESSASRESIEGLKFLFQSDANCWLRVMEMIQLYNKTNEQTN